MSARYALYFAPDEDSELAKFGQAVLQRSAATHRDVSANSEFPDRTRWMALTRSPAHYGFHATLKAPFELTDGTDFQTLHEAVARFIQPIPCIPLTGLSPHRLQNFYALTLNDTNSELDDFAFRVVSEFDSYRKPLSDEDLQRRQQQTLSTRQQWLLERYGYPYVDDEFRFHMTLTGTLQEHDTDFVQWLNTLYNRYMTQTPTLDRLAIYSQPDRQAPFFERAAFPLASINQ